jgi:hypothetical protein
MTCYGIRPRRRCSTTGLLCLPIAILETSNAPVMRAPEILSPSPYPQPLSLLLFSPQSGPSAWAADPDALWHSPLRAFRQSTPVCLSRRPRSSRAGCSGLLFHPAPPLSRTDLTEDLSTFTMDLQTCVVSIAPTEQSTQDLDTPNCFRETWMTTECFLCKRLYIWSRGRHEGSSLQLQWAKANQGSRQDASSGLFHHARLRVSKSEGPALVWSIMCNLLAVGRLHGMLFKTAFSTELFNDSIVGQSDFVRNSWKPLATWA